MTAVGQMTKYSHVEPEALVRQATRLFANTPDGPRNSRGDARASSEFVVNESAQFADLNRQRAGNVRGTFMLANCLPKHISENAGHRYFGHQTIFKQGDAAQAVYYIRRGRVMLHVLSMQGKDAVTALLGEGDLFGEACLAGQTNRAGSATAMVECSIIRIEAAEVIRQFNADTAFSHLFLQRLIARNVRTEEALLDHLFYSCEKRLAHVLLLLADLESAAEAPFAEITPINQETLAEIVGTTRSRVSYFMNRFRKLGLVEYHGKGRMKVYQVQLSAVMRGECDA
ncbi:MAG: Crp/Fnr family transcriptional regulator [Acidobacteriota bacterium]